MRKLVLYGNVGGEALRQYTLRQGLGPILDNVVPSITTFVTYRTSGIAVSPDKSKAALTNGSSGNTAMTLYRSLLEGGLFTSHENPANSFVGAIECISANNQYVAFGGSGSTFLQVMDWATLTPRPVPVGGLNTVYGAAFSPDGSKIAITYASGNYLRIYNISDWSYIEPSSASHRPGGGRGGLVWSADGSKLLVSGGASAPYISVHDATNCNRLHAVTASAIAYNIVKIVPSLVADQFYMCSEQPGLSYNQLSRFDLSTYGFTHFPRLPGTAPGISNIAVDEVERYLYLIHDRSPSQSCIKRISIDSPVTYESLGEIDRTLFAWSVSMAIIQKNHYQLAGSVRDVDNQPAARVIRAFERSTGRLMGQTVSNAVTGNYLLLLPDAGPYDVQFLTEEGELLNDLFFADAQPQPVV